jgi:alpha-pyrone synthase
MSYILDISTALPEFAISNERYLQFYAKACKQEENPAFLQKLQLLRQKTKINQRYSCIPDFNGEQFELFEANNHTLTLEKRLDIYRKKVVPLATQAIDRLLKNTGVAANEITHLITVSCTGMFAPGLEFLLADHYGMKDVEKSAVNFLGCYAALKALKQARYITQAYPQASVLIVSAELCSLHFFPSMADEDVVANLLFADGAAAVLVCGKENKHVQNKVLLSIDETGTTCIPDSAKLMTWEMTSHAFRMFLSKQIVQVIRENIEPVMKEFLGEEEAAHSVWAIHPGGIKIVEAIQDKLGLSPQQVEDSLHVLAHQGNMSSPTILFILERIFQKLKSNPSPQKIVSCAFGPGITVELIRFSVALPEANSVPSNTEVHAVEH